MANSRRSSSTCSTDETDPIFPVPYNTPENSENEMDTTGDVLDISYNGDAEYDSEVVSLLSDKNYFFDPENLLAEHASDTDEDMVEEKRFTIIESDEVNSVDVDSLV